MKPELLLEPTTRGGSEPLGGGIRDPTKEGGLGALRSGEGWVRRRNKPRGVEKSTGAGNCGRVSTK